MKIILIRHGKVNMEWAKSYDSKGFDESQAKYDISPLFDYTGRVGRPDGYRIYISKLQRTYDTAMQIFDFNGDVNLVDFDEMLEKGYTPKTEKEKNMRIGSDEGQFDYDENRTLFKTHLLNEVPKRSFKDTESKSSKAIWTAKARIQWYMNNHRQPEVKSDTKARAEQLVSILEAEGKDCVLVSHEFFLYTLKGVLEKRGFVIERSSTGRIKNWERIRASKRDMHCGVCGHNCLLTNPGCNVGRDAAARQGIKIKE